MTYIGINIQKELKNDFKNQYSFFEKVWLFVLFLLEKMLLSISFL